MGCSPPVPPWDRRQPSKISVSITSFLALQITGSRSEPVCERPLDSVFVRYRICCNHSFSDSADYRRCGGGAHAFLASLPLPRTAVIASTSP